VSFVGPVVVMACASGPRGAIAPFHVQLIFQPSDLKKRHMADRSEFRVAAISRDVIQILVPVVFMRGLPGSPPQDNTFLISQTFVRDATGWYVASILPIANTELR
jgi:hypothetical protein